MKRIFFILALLAFGTQVHAQVAAEAAVETADAKVNWMTWDEAAEAMKTEPKKIMVDVYTDWCGWCKRMDATTMKDPMIVQLLNQDYYAVKMDGEYKENIQFRDRVYKYVANGRRGYHELPAELMNGRMSYPTLVFLDENFGIIQPLPGYQQARGLEKILAFFGGDYYKNTSWEAFQQQYKSPMEQ